MLYITQPTYFPWIGFFSFIEKSKKIVFLDDVQFVRGKWQQRNKIINQNTFQYLTVPVKKKGLYKQNLNEVEINDKLFFKEHLKKIKNTYSRTKYFDEIYQEFYNLETKISSTNKLSEINILIIKKILDLVKINKNFEISSNLKVDGKRSEKLKNICIKLEYKDLLSNEGSKEYILNDIEIFKKNNINLHFFKYENIKYNQINKNFIENLSILDLLFNLGTDCMHIIKKGLREI